MLSEGRSIGLLISAAFLASVCLLLEWKTIIRFLRIRSVSLATIERLKPRMPHDWEIIATNALTILLIVLSVQFIGIVYAMAYTLSSSSAETLEARHLIAGDVDNDGDTDYVALNYSTSAVNVNLYTNNGTGTFSPTTVATLSYVWDGCFADVNGDGDNDILLIDAASAGSERLRVLRNTAGSFTSVSTVTVQANSRSLACADIDNDGDIDAIMGSDQGTMTQAVFLNNGYGVFASAASTLDIASEMTTADFTSDGYLDLAIVGNHKLRVYRGSGTGAFTETTNYNFGSETPTEISASDVDGDGDIDIVATDTATSNNMIVFKNNGAGTSFTNASSTPNLYAINDLSTGDADNDGDIDLLLGGSDATAPANGNELRANDGTAVFTSSWQLAGADTTTQSLVFFDFDGDGDLDYVRGNSSGTANNRYVSDAAATTANTAPTAPSTGFGVTLFSQNNQATTLDSSGDVGQETSLALGADGLPVLSYFDATNTDLKVTKCGNAACSSGNTTTTVDSTGTVGQGNSITLGSDGFPVVSYYDASNGDLKVTKCGNAACSSGNTTTTVDSTGTVGVDTAIALGADNFPVISYSDGTNNDLKVTKCGNAACSSGNTTTTVDSTGIVGAPSSIIIGSDGFPVISYLDDTNDDLKVIKCGNAACSSGNTTTTVDSTNLSGLESSIAIGNDNFPVISYWESMFGDLKVTKCGNAACSSGNTTTTVDSTDQTGRFTSIAVPSDGFPIISYYSVTNANLSVVKCGNAACSSGNTISLVDVAAGSLGSYTSLKVPSDGKPVISYYDDSNDDLKVTKCGNASCSAGGTDGAATLRLSWGSGSDTETATRLLQYQVRVGTGSSAHNIVSGKTASPNWTSRVMPNGQSRTYLIKNLVCRTGLTYYWSVSTVDTGFKSTASTGQTFTLDDSCTLSSGGSSSPPPPPSTGGGGLAWFLFHQSTDAPEEAPKTGKITVTAFNDVNGDGVKQRNERTGFKGLAITASGTTTEETYLTSTLSLPEAGTVSFDLPPGDGSGYTVSFDTGSLAFEGYEPTTATFSGGLVIKAGSALKVSFGFRRADLLAYKPCLSVGSPEGTAPSASDASSLLIRLQDGFGRSMIGDMALSGTLVTRGNFLTLLQRTQCIPFLTTNVAMIGGLRDKEDVSWPLIDLPLNLHAEDALTTYSLLAAGIRADRKTLKGAAADLLSPVTRREAMLMVFDALDVPPAKQVATGGTLPSDLDPEDSLVPVFLTLDSLGILPESFRQILGASRGVNPDEMSLLLATGAFSAGKISLLPQAPDPGIRQNLKRAVSTPTFLKALPAALRPQTCLERHPERVADLSFQDVLPGDPLFHDLSELVSFGTKNPDGKTIWLLPATSRPTEYGVAKGKAKAGLSEPVGILETLRDLLVLSCLPQYTPQEVVKGTAVRLQEGSAESRIPRDRITDLPRDSSFASRVLYRAQDHEREFDLSLFTYAPELLRLSPRGLLDPLSLEEAASLLSSALLRIAVKQKILTPQEAEGMSGDVRSAIARDFLGQTIDWRSEAVLQQTVFTRGMLLQFLATVTLNRTSTSSDSSSVPVSLGEIWWERVR